MKIYYEKYGCSLNQAETEFLVSSYVKNGNTLVENPESADLIIIGTCVVIKHTENHMISRIKHFYSMNKKILVYGCLPAVYKNLLSDFNGIKTITPREIYPNDSFFIENYATIPIAQGCTGHCTYCISKLARGNLKSYPEELIVSRVKEAVMKGIKEIRLTALDTAAYGIDLNSNLPSLLNKIDEIEGEFRVRIGMMEPANTIKIIDDLIESFKSEKIFKFFHIPVQSGDDKILKLMGRNYTSSDFVQIVESIRKNFTHYTLSTDIIVGFPGENESTFNSTIEIVKKTRPDIMNITRFSPREGTIAYSLKQVKSSLAKEWSKKLTELHQKISEENNSEMLGKKFKILLTEKGKRNYLGRTDGYRPVIVENGEIYRFYDVEIYSFTPFYLIGKILNQF
ncbi:MAG: tRNA (N(6)-L-threonylcarbamoyladenosine(37)-C(2))-methylthiotransferase [Thermoplasmata archaeon]|nr:tRNA (N(6)-L-threonylcarbamoyladenosine(37)-C(2))-methylthiotransferase [Staphylococcus epidermidis]